MCIPYLAKKPSSKIFTHFEWTRGISAYFERGSCASQKWSYLCRASMDSDEIKTVKHLIGSCLLFYPFLIVCPKELGQKVEKKSVKLMIFKPKFWIFCTIFHQK